MRDRVHAPVSDVMTMRAASRLRDVAEAGVLCSGAQIYVSVDGRVQIDEAYGDARPGRPMQPTTVLPLYCATKPIVALAVDQLVAGGICDLDRPLGPGLLPQAPADVQATTVRQVLSHQAGLPVFERPPWWALIDDETRRTTLLSASQRLRPGSTAYSAFVAWNLLDEAARTSVGVDLCELAQNHVLGPLGVADLWIHASVEDYR